MVLPEARHLQLTIKTFVNCLGVFAVGKKLEEKKYQKVTKRKWLLSLVLIVFIWLNLISF